MKKANSSFLKHYIKHKKPNYKLVFSKKSIYLLAIFYLITSGFSFASHSNETLKKPNQKETISITYNKMMLESVINYKLFEEAYCAYNKTKNRKKNILTIIDYSKPSTEKRFYVIDLEKKKLMFHTYVSHGVNSGTKIAKYFSNTVNSRKTSLGTFLTDSTYYGANGYSLRIDGLTRGVNDKARERYIVVHGAKYANPSVIKKIGYLGRSWGCPAVPEHLSRPIIDMIKDGSVIYASA